MRIVDLADPSLLERPAHLSPPSDSPICPASVDGIGHTPRQLLKRAAVPDELPQCPLCRVCFLARLQAVLDQDDVAAFERLGSGTCHK